MMYHNLILYFQIDNLHLEVTISKEKHRTCSDEVIVRDESIIRLQTEIDRINQAHTNTMEEVSKGNRFDMWLDRDELKLLHYTLGVQYTAVR